MKKFLLSIVVILSLISCCKKKGLKINQNELYGNVLKLVEYTSLKNNDLTQGLQTDTTQIRTVYFENGLRIKTVGYHTFNQDSLITKVHYDKNKLKRKETIYLSDGSSFDVHYKYNDSLIETSETNYIANDISLNTISNYYYNINGTIEKNITKQLVTDTQSKDTIQGYIETTEFDSNGDSKIYFIKYLDTTDLSGKRILKRDCNGLVMSFKSYENEKFISKTKYKYTFDSIGNWKTSKVIVNDTLRKIIEREIIYE